ncbi:MAG TPA: dienelactone hydrolase family protein [Polyangiales bacterium]
MKRVPLLALLCLLAACRLREEAPIQGLRGARFGDEWGSMKYRYYVPPQADVDHRLPLVLYLHGDGMQGRGNKKHVDARVTRWVDNQDAHPCFVLAPQLPRGAWVNADITFGSYTFEEAAITESMRLVIDLVSLFVKHYPIDRNRVYVVGTSLGGFATWDLLMRKPEGIAAAVPIEGAGDPKQAARIANVPIWAFHGALDHVVPVSGSRAMIEALRAAGGAPKYTEYPDVDHDSGPRVFAPATGLDDWLFAQRRPLR